MSAISSVGSATPVDAYSAPQSAPPAKQAQSKPIEDTVQLSKAAQAAIAGGGGDADHDGDSH